MLRLTIKLAPAKNWRVFQRSSSVYRDVRYPPNVRFLPKEERFESDVQLAVKTVKELRKWIE